MFYVEYPDLAPVSVSATTNADCNALRITGSSTVMKNMTLGGWVIYCGKS
jgi:hypothetical protein